MSDRDRRGDKWDVGSVTADVNRVFVICLDRYKNAVSFLSRNLQILKIVTYSLSEPHLAETIRWGMERPHRSKAGAPSLAIGHLKFQKNWKIDNFFLFWLLLALDEKEGRHLVSSRVTNMGIMIRFGSWSLVEHLWWSILLRPLLVCNDLNIYTP